MKNSLKNFLFPNKKEDQFETKLDINEDSKEKTYSNATISKENFVQSYSIVKNHFLLWLQNFIKMSKWWLLNY